MASMRRRSALWSIVAVAGACLLVGALVLLRTRAPVAPPAPPAAESARATFAAWLAFEPEKVRAEPAARERYIDAMLGHQVFQIPPSGLNPMQARDLMLDDDKLLLSSGRRLWNQELLHQPGLAGKFCYLHSSFCVKRLADVQFFIDGKPAVIYDNQYRIERYPTHTMIKYQLAGLSIDEAKFITDDDRAVLSYAASSADKKPHRLDIEVTAPYLTMPNTGDDPAYPLLGHGSLQNLPLFVYLDAPGFQRAETSLVHLRRVIDVPGDGSSRRAQVAVSFENQQRTQSDAALPDDLLERHIHEYHQWFADNVPYFDASDQGFKRMWYYRWWLVRFNMTQANTPDLQGYRFYEGKLGFDNPITFAIPVQVKELTYLRDPQFALQQIQNTYRNVSPTGAVVDPPGSPYWNENYSHWIAAAVEEYSRVHPLPPATLRALLPAMAGDVRAWLTAFDPDHDGLPSRSRPRVTGYDLDILSYWYFNGTKLDLEARPPDLERVDFASFVYANARAVADLARTVGDASTAAEFDALAERTRNAVLTHLWDDQTQFFYPQRADDDTRIPIRELHGFFPFTTLLAPDEPRYVAALQKFVDPNEFWARYPPVIASLYHYHRWTWGMDGLSRNIAPHPISMGARTAMQAIKHYHQNAITPAHFMELMARYNDLVYPGVNPYDPYWRPNAHEYYSKWEPNQVSERPKPSDISHDFHSMYNSLIVEGVVGLTPRRDAKIELQPAAFDWNYFLLDRLRYQGKDLTIVWDRPDGDVRYHGYPEGFSLYVDGKQAFTRPQLGHVVYDPATATLEEAEQPAPSGAPAAPPER
jgi:hypothetical protein